MYVARRFEEPRADKVQYPHESTRAIVDLLANHVIRNHPSVRLIASHGGGTLPIIGHRFVGGLSSWSPELGTKADYLADLRSMFFDTAIFGNANGLNALLEFASPDHLLVGSDWPCVLSLSLSRTGRGIEAKAGMRSRP